MGERLWNIKTYEKSFCLFHSTKVNIDLLFHLKARGTVVPGKDSKGCSTQVHSKVAIKMKDPVTK